MPVPVIIPKATISMDEAVIIKWLKSEGDVVAKDDLLFEMETDKAILEVAAPATGVLLRILTPQGSVKVEQVVGWIGQPGEAIETPADAPAATVASEPNLSAPAPEERRATTAPLATPAARRRARELGIDLTKVAAAGRVIKEEDVERALQAPIPNLNRLLEERKPLIQRLSGTWRGVPHIHIARWIDAQKLIEASKRSAQGISITDFMLFALAKVLPCFPELTMTWSGDQLQPATSMNLAFAVDTDRGVVAPVLRDAGSLSLNQLSQRRAALTEAARTHRLRLQELEGGVFTLTNLGTEGVDFFAPVLNAPQTAILAIGRAAQHAVVVNGAVGIGWRMWANLAVDHRVTDGALAGRFLAQLQDWINRLPQEVSETK